MADPNTLQEPPEPARIRRLRQLVTLLTLTLTIGIMVVVGMLAWRLSVTGPAPALPDAVALPAGERLTGYAQNPDWTVLITTDDTGTQRLHLIRPGATTPHQSLTISP